MTGVRRVLYRLPEIINAVAAGDRIYICEGEKDADRACEAGLVATTNPGGAGKWRPEYSDLLRGAEVVIVRHRDSAGHRHAEEVAASLRAVDCSVQVVETKAGNDLSDHLDAGHAIEDLFEVEGDKDNGPARATSERSPIIRLTDVGNALRLVKQHGDDLRFRPALSPTRGEWLVWDGRRWAVDETGEVVRRAKETVATIYAEAADTLDEDPRKSIAKWGRQSESRHHIFNMIKLAESEEHVCARPQEFDTDPFALNVLNGTVNLRDGALRSHRCADMITKLAPVQYDPDARSELFDRFLGRALPDADARRYAQKAAGYSLLGQAGADVLLLVHGLPRTGKGTFQEALASTLGDYAATAGLEDFAQRRGQGGARPEIVRLQGVRLVSIYETSRRLRLSASLIKTLTGNDPVTARDLYKGPVTFLPQFTLWIATNYRPPLPDDDAAIWERVRELPFNTVIPEHERDPAVRAELRDPKASGAAVLAWAIEGCLAYQREGLVAPEIVKEATQDYREEMDPLRDFFADGCVFAPEAWVKSSELVEAYEGWCKENGERPLGGRHFRERLRDHGCEPAPRNVGRGWSGIALMNEEL